MGQRLVIEVLGGERTRYRTQLIGSLIGQLGERPATEFGRSFEAKSMRRIPGVSQFNCRDTVTTIELESCGGPVATQGRAGPAGLFPPQAGPLV